MLLLHPNKDGAIDKTHKVLVVTRSISAGNAWRIVESRPDEESANALIEELHEQQRQRMAAAKTGKKLRDLPHGKPEYRVVPITDYLTNLSTDPA